MHPRLARILERSETLETRLLDRLAPAAYPDTDRDALIVSVCGIGFVHGNSLRALIATDRATSAAALLRPQFEALARAMWLHYAATDAAVARLSAPLTADSEKAAGDSPSMRDMMSSLEKKADPNAYEMLRGLKENAWKAMNSFVHGGIHSVRRFSDGYPITLLDSVIRMSNAMITMIAMVQALRSGAPEVVHFVRTCQPEFADCLPPLLSR